MNFKNVASYFDRDKMYDGYTGSFLFNCQVASFDSSQPDGSFQRRRTVSAAPDTVLPTKRVGLLYGKRWVLGEFVVDGFYSEAVRATASSKEVTDYFTLLTPGQAALDLTVGVSNFYGCASFTKEAANTITDSYLDGVYEVTAGKNEDLPKGYFLRSENKLLHINGTHTPLEGFRIATTNEVSYKDSTAWQPNSIVTVSIAGAYDPITDTEDVAGAPTTGVLLDLYKLFNYKTEADPTKKPGDMTLVVAKSAITPVAGATATVGGLKAIIVSVISHFDSWALHIRAA